MGWFGSDSGQQASDSYDAYNSVPPEEHKSSITHELLAGAAAYEAAKAYENHVAKNGQPPSHEKAKEILAGFAGAFVDREVETKGLDFIDKQKAKHAAAQQSQDYVDPDSFGGGGGDGY